MFYVKWYKNVAAFTIGWIVALFIWRLIRIDGIIASLNILNLNFSSLNFILFIVITSLIAGITFGSIQFYNDYLSMQMTSFRGLLFRALGIHLLVMLCLYWLVFVSIKHSGINAEILFKDFIQNPLIVVNLIYSLLINTIIVIIIHLNKLFGKGNLVKLITGKFYKPIEELRIFMFIDLQSSTTIAENLGHIKYSKLLQDCFFDLSVIESTNAEIYQYVGDEAVLTWKLSKGYTLDNCFKAFYLFKEKLQSKKEYYQSNYGVLPIFSAGMHLGPVTTAEVGSSLKREIAYHGDTLNIASRIQAQCKVLKKEFLVSSIVLNNYKNENVYMFEEFDALVLRGKLQSTFLLAVSKKDK
jgi:adenylate cyclase